MSTTGYTAERARLHDEQIQFLLIELTQLGYEPHELPVDGHRPDIWLEAEQSYIDVKVGRPNLAIEINSLMTYRQIQVNEMKRVYIVHYDSEHDPQHEGNRWVHTIDSLRPISGPQRPTGNGSNDDWQLFQHGRITGTPFHLFFVDKAPF